MFAAKARAAALYGFALLAASLVAAPTAAEPAASADTIAAIRALSIGEMAGLQVHDAPFPAAAEPYTGADGAPETFADHSGKVLLVNFWAMWCPPCLKELPSINDLAAEMDAAGHGETLEVLVVNIDRGAAVERAKGFLATNELTALDFLHASGTDLPRAVNIVSMPVTLLIDQNGYEVARLARDADWNSAEVKAILERLVAGDG